MEIIRASGRPCELVVIQKTGGTRATILAGREWVRDALAEIATVPRLPLEVADLIVATECGGSDATSGLTANPAIGIACDHVIEAGGSAIFEELGELFGCEEHMAARALTPALGRGDQEGHGQGHPPLRGARPEQLRRRQHHRRAVDDRGEVDRRLRQERHQADRAACCGPASCRRAPACT